LIAIPFSWWITSAWLQNFVYRIALSPLIFVVTGVSVLVITLVTISFQSIRAAIAKPVNSLKMDQGK
jgi:putative ABC transport system permease protein